MSERVTGSLQLEGTAALSLMEHALDLLDRCDVPIDIGAHLDLAICRLREAIHSAGPAAGGGPGETCS
jgi:hypothetical protein